LDWSWFQTWYLGRCTSRCTRGAQLACCATTQNLNGWFYIPVISNSQPNNLKEQEDIKKKKINNKKTTTLINGISFTECSSSSNSSSVRIVNYCMV
jgi:hypothetical protein